MCNNQLSAPHSDPCRVRRVHVLPGSRSEGGRDEFHQRVRLIRVRADVIQTVGPDDLGLATQKLPAAHNNHPVMFDQRDKSPFLRLSEPVGMPVHQVPGTCDPENPGQGILARQPVEPQRDGRRLLVLGRTVQLNRYARLPGQLTKCVHQRRTVKTDGYRSIESGFDGPATARQSQQGCCTNHITRDSHLLFFLRPAYLAGPEGRL